MYDELWLVAGGEPGAKRFGHLVQSQRKSKRMSVEDVATQAELSVGSVRAIEQGRRAPSEESGVRLLDLLLPASSLPSGEGRSNGPGEVGYDYSFIDPASGSRVILRFKARTAGDNRRWSSDFPRPGESVTESVLRKIMGEPGGEEKLRETMHAVASTFQKYLPALEELKARAARPADDEDYGRLVRKLVGYNEYRLDRIEKLLIWWDKVDDGTADDSIHRVVEQVESALDSITILSPEDRAMIENDRSELE